MEKKFFFKILKNVNKKIETTASDIKDEVDKPKKVEKALVEISPKKRPKRKGSGLFSKILNTISGNNNLEEKPKKGSSKKTYSKRRIAYWRLRKNR